MNKQNQEMCSEENKQPTIYIFSDHDVQVNHVMERDGDPHALEDGTVDKTVI